MTKQDLHELVWNYLFDKAYDEDKLFEEIEYLLKSFDQWCGYTSQEIWEYWNDNKTYDVDGIKITPTLKKQLFVFKNKLEEKESK